MLNQVFRDKDVSLDLFQGKTIAILGYGIQGARRHFTCVIVD
jgi:ketol-acid reductoisomerase